ncbi:hypothetical protein [Streptomyces sp. AK02-01A]|nr:hypothetical protein [Streptomyces sp. AK02-01A]MDX3852719.1 hypothetical protein [Streptomyces sp. AK02-01A]
MAGNVIGVGGHDGAVHRGERSPEAAALAVNKTVSAERDAVVA